MRYKVRVSSDADYQNLVQELKDRDVTVLARAPRRKSLAIADPSADVRRRISELGADLVPDVQYEPEGESR